MSNEHWIHSLPIAAKSALLKQVCLPGTHDSAAYKNMETQIQLDGEEFFTDIVRGLTPVTFTGIYHQVNKFTKTQDTTVYQQLMNGIRYFDLRFAYSSRYQTFYTLHGIAMGRLDVALNDIKRFSISHPKEMIMIDLGLYFTLSDKSEIGKKGLEFVIDYLGDLVYKRDAADDPQLFWIKSINDIVNSGSPILLIEHNFHSYYLSVQPKDIWDVWINTNKDKEKIDGLRKQVEVFNPGTKNYYKLEWTLTPQVPQIIFGWTGLKDMSKRMQSKLVPFLDSLSVENRAKIGIIAVDFESQIDLAKICKDLVLERFS